MLGVPKRTRTTLPPAVAGRRCKKEIADTGCLPARAVGVFRGSGAALPVAVAALALNCAYPAEKGAFPSRPLDRTQVLVWMDFGEAAGRVETLIGRAGVDFKPSDEYLELLKSIGAPADLLETLRKLQPTGTPARDTPAQQAAFGQLSKCLTLARQSQFVDAEKECQAATSAEPSVSYNALGDVLLREQKFQVALAALRSAEKADPSVPEIHNWLGLTLRRLGDMSGAKKEYEKAVELDREYETPHCNLADLALIKHDLKRAESEAREALRLDPSSASAHNNLAGVFLFKGDVDDMIAELRTAAQLEPGGVFRHSALAQALLMKKDYEGAAAEYRTALSLAPDWAEGHARLARVLLELHRPDEAVAECQAAGQVVRHMSNELRAECDAIREQAAAAATRPGAAGTTSQGGTAAPLQGMPLPRNLQVMHDNIVQKLQEMKPEEFAAVQGKAAAGDAAAETMVCMARRLGKFVPQDDGEALNWCEKAAKQNDLVAEEDAGLQYARGLGVQRDTMRGIEWLKKAASQGSIVALGNLGSIYANGSGVPVDYAEAMKWYRMGADRDDGRSETDIGIMYLLGQGVKRDPAEALRWFRKAADRDYAYADFLLAMVYQQGLGVTQNQKESLKWVTRAANLGAPQAQTELGWMYANGIGVRRDYSEAVKWYRAAAEQGDAAGAYGLGVRYLMGQGVSRDYAQAEKWLLVAAEGGHGDASYNLGLMYLGKFPDQPGPRDEARAAKYLQAAADQGIGDGQCYLGKLYAEGTGLAKNNILAYQWMLLASKNGAEQCLQFLKPLEAAMKSNEVEEARRRAAAWSPQPHPQFNY